MFFASPTSNITPALVSVAMSRSDSRDSNTSRYPFTSQPMTVSYSTSPQSYSMSRTFSTSSSSIKSSSSMQRRESSSSSQWMPSPYRSCMSHSSQEEHHEPSSYLSDDDLLYLDCGIKYKALPIESIPNPEPSVLRRKELTTEEQIAMLRELQEKEQQFEQRRSSSHHHQKMVRFATEQRKARRPSTQRRTAPARKGLSHLNGPM